MREEDKRALFGAWAEFVRARDDEPREALRTAAVEWLRLGCSVSEVSQRLGVSRAFVRLLASGPGRPLEARSGVRGVPVPPEAVEALKRHVACLQERLGRAHGRVATLLGDPPGRGAGAQASPDFHHFLPSPRRRSRIGVEIASSDAQQLATLASIPAGGSEFASLAGRLRAGGTSYADLDRAAGLPVGRTRARLLKRGLI